MVGEEGQAQGKHDYYLQLLSAPHMPHALLSALLIATRDSHHHDIRIMSPFLQMGKLRPRARATEKGMVQSCTVGIIFSANFPKV